MNVFHGKGCRWGWSVINDLSKVGSAALQGAVVIWRVMHRSASHIGVWRSMRIGILCRSLLIIFRRAANVSKALGTAVLPHRGDTHANPHYGNYSANNACNTEAQSYTEIALNVLTQKEYAGKD